MKEELLEKKQELMEIIPEKVEIKNNDEYLNYGDLVYILREEMNEIEKQRKEVTVPIDEAKKSAMKKYKEIITPIKTKYAEIRSRMLQYYENIHEQQREEIKEKGEVENVFRRKQEGRLAKITIGQKKDIKVTDKSKLPLKYLKVDKVKLKKDLFANEDLKIKGVERIYTDNLIIR